MLRVDAVVEGHWVRKRFLSFHDLSEVWDLPVALNFKAFRCPNVLDMEGASRLADALRRGSMNDGYVVGGDGVFHLYCPPQQVSALLLDDAFSKRAVRLGNDITYRGLKFRDRRSAFAYFDGVAFHLARPATLERVPMICGPVLPNVMDLCIRWEAP